MIVKAQGECKGNLAGNLKLAICKHIAISVGNLVCVNAAEIIIQINDGTAGKHIAFKYLLSYKIEDF